MQLISVTETEKETAYIKRGLKRSRLSLTSMQLTRAADYAIRVMIHLASQPEGTIVPKTLLAEATEAPESFLSKILQSLARAGLIQARRGVVGGYSLLPRGAQASLLDVVEAMDGPIALNVCVTSGTACHRHPECAAHEVWVRAQSAMLSVLADAKVMKMVSQKESGRPLLNFSPVTGSGEQESNPLSKQCKYPQEPKNHRVTVRSYRSAAHNEQKTK
jgi:Rrf2 family protein